MVFTMRLIISIKRLKMARTNRKKRLVSDKREVKIVAKRSTNVKSTSGKIVVTGKGFHRKIDVVLFSEHQANRIFDVVDKINSSSVGVKKDLSPNL